MNEFDAFSIFNFAERLLFHLHPDAVVKVKDDRTWQTLTEIVNGETCLVPSPQEMLKHCAEDRKDAVLACLQRNGGKLIAKDSEIAQAIIDSFAQQQDRNLGKLPTEDNE